MKTLAAVAAQWLANPDIRAEYDTQAKKFAATREWIAARTPAGLTQSEVAQLHGRSRTTCGQHSHQK